MKTSSLILITFYVILAFNETRAQALSNPEADVRMQFDRFKTAFNNRDSVKLASEFIQTPINLGGWKSTPEDVIRAFSIGFHQIEQQGWSKTKTISLNLCGLSETLVFLDNEYSRLKEDGTVIDGPPIRRTLQVWQKVKDELRIVALYDHDPSIRIGCEK